MKVFFCSLFSERKEAVGAIACNIDLPSRSVRIEKPTIGMEEKKG